MSGLVEKIEINCDMGEGFGRWKMASQLPACACYELADSLLRDPMKN